MKENDTNKKRHILVTAMKLFSSKNYNKTSMQEIADICGISKGSLYLFFKSKEDLLLNVFQYYFQHIEDQMILIEEAPYLSAKEKFAKEIGLKLGHYIENQEFYRMQSQDISGLPNKDIYRYLHQKNISQIQWLEQSLIKIYGREIKPYSADGAFLLMGMISQYMELIIKKQLPLRLDEVVRFLITQIDFIIKGLSENNITPLFNEALWSVYLEEASEKKVHPLELIKQIKDQLKTLSIPAEKKEVADQSLNIMEQELMDMQPRIAILKGMLHNLEPIRPIEEMRVKLANSLQVNWNH